MFRYLPWLATVLLLALCLVFWRQHSWLIYLAVALIPLALTGLYDVLQRRHSLWRNFPLFARIRWVAEELRPFLRAYIVESETEGRPFNHEERTLVYRRAKDVSSVEPFGSHLDIDKPPYEWLAHSIAAKHPEEANPRVLVGAPETS
ncbi:MAG TPA: FMN-binding glutamate synthase family protein, partial [Hyphomonas sp.]|nr:FMN-binding glutamate synthase family protein [Hyphomonas sp.]